MKSKYIMNIFPLIKTYGFIRAIDLEVHDLVKISDVLYSIESIYKDKKNVKLFLCADGQDNSNTDLNLLIGDYIEVFRHNNNNIIGIL